MENDHIIANPLNEAPSQSTHHIDIEPNPPQDQPDNKIDSHSMIIIGKYLNTFDDFVNLEKTCREYRGITEQYHFNPILFKNEKEREIFSSIETLNLYDGYDPQTTQIDTILKSNAKIKKIIIYEDDDENENENEDEIKDKIKNGTVEIRKNKTGKFKFNMDPNISVLVGVDDSIYEDNPEIKEIVIPRHITRIRKNCFSRGLEKEIYGRDFSDGIKDIFIPNSVKVICPRAFFSCGITSIDIPSSISFIPESCFAECIRLESIHLPNTIEFLDKKAFTYCSSLKNIELPSSITSIGEDCFRYCTSLSNVIITSNLVSIGEGCFTVCGIKHFYSNNEDITTYSINLPSTLTKLGEYAFSYCEQITSINYNIPQIPLGCFKDCSKLEMVKLPNKLTRIRSFAFEKCIKLKSIYLPSNLKDIGSRTFENCIQLSSINIPSTLTHFEGDCFINCNLTQINIPSNLKRIIKEYSIKDIKDKIKWVSPYD